MKINPSQPYNAQKAGLMTAAGLLLLISALPFLQWIALPLQFLETHLHELGHALAGLATGGSVSEIKVFGDGSGLTYVFNGFYPVVASAGYVGSTLFGVLAIWVGRDESSARGVLGGFGGLLAITDIIWLRGDFVGEISGIGLAVLLIGLAIYLRGRAAVIVVQFLGLQQALSAIKSVFALLGIGSLVPDTSDATLLAQATGIPPFFWAVSWAAISVILLAVSLRAVWTQKPLQAE